MHAKFKLCLIQRQIEEKKEGKKAYFVLYPLTSADSSDPPWLCPLWVGGRGRRLFNPLAMLLATFCLRPDDGSWWWPRSFSEEDEVSCPLSGFIELATYVLSGFMDPVTYVPSLLFLGVGVLQADLPWDDGGCYNNYLCICTSTSFHYKTHYLVTQSLQSTDIVQIYSWSLSLILTRSINIFNESEIHFKNSYGNTASLHYDPGTINFTIQRLH